MLCKAVYPHVKPLSCPASGPARPLHWALSGGCGQPANQVGKSTLGKQGQSTLQLLRDSVPELKQCVTASCDKLKEMLTAEAEVGHTGGSAGTGDSQMSADC